MIKKIYILLENTIYNLSLDIYELAFFINKNFKDYIKIKITFFLHYITFNPYTYSIKKLKSLQNQDYIYGETPYITTYYLLKDFIDKDTTFIDIGSGRGKTIFFVANYFKNIKNIGIDIAKEYINRANKLKNKLKLNNAEFICNDFLKFNFKDLKYKKLIIFITATLFKKTTIEKLIKKLTKIKKDSILILLSYKIIDKKNFKEIATVIYPFSWGKNTVYIYKRI